MVQILLVDDDDFLREGFEQLLVEEGYGVIAVSSGSEALEKFSAGLHVQCIVMDIRLPGLDGLSVLKKMRERPDCPPIVIMTAYGTTESAIEATKHGAFDYILKPFEIPDMLDLIARAVEAGERQREILPLETSSKKDEGVRLVGSSAPMQEIYKAIGRVAPTDALVLLRGESGTGKEVVARSIWRYSPRASKPLVVINCVAIPDTLLESELFGYEKGSFTGASASRAGRIEQAAGGTVFLDEIGDMPLSVQAKFLRLLQEKQIERIGTPNPIKVDVRIIAATNVDLEKAVQEGRFRKDLYYRLKVVTLFLPPLRDRKEDIPELASALLSSQSKSIGVKNTGIEQDALDYLGTLSWPGNVRELSNLLQKVLVFSTGSPICKGDILRAMEQSDGVGQKETEDAPSTQREQTSSLEAENDIVLSDVNASDVEGILTRIIDGVFTSGREDAFEACMDVMGRAATKRALELAGGNRSKAARILGLSRPTLLARMERYGLKIETKIT